MDAALHLMKNGSDVTVLDAGAPWDKKVHDSSYGLSPATRGKVREMLASGKVQFIAAEARRRAAVT